MNNRTRHDGRSRGRKSVADTGFMMLVPAVLMAIMAAACNGETPFGGWRSSGQETEVDDQPFEEVEFAVHSAAVVKGDITDYLDLGGDVVAKGTVDAYTETSGKLIRLYKKVGEYVAKGDPLADIDPSKPGMNYVAHTVTSPISGTITAIPVEEGATVSLAIPVAKIGRLDDLEIHSYVPERFISRVETGMRAEVTLEAYPAVAFRARVRELSPVVDPISRTMEVTLTFDSYDRRVKAGMYASVRIRTDTRRNAVLIPSDAIITRYGDDAVFVVGDDGRVYFRPVTEGIRRDGISEIVDGLTGEESIVVAGQSLLDDGTKVRVIKEVPSVTSGDA